MGRSWRLLFRSLAVPTILFLAPIVVVQEVPRLLYFLTVKNIVSELALDITVMLALEAGFAALIAALLATGRALRLLTTNRADTHLGAGLAFTAITLCGLAVVYPLDAIVGPAACTAAQAAIIAAALALATLFGWRRVVALLNRLNRSSEIVLAVVPVFMIVAIQGGFGWRSFDRMPDRNRASAERSARPNVVLISFDALAAEDMSLYGYSRHTTPQFERLARRSYNFVNVYSTSDFTTPAVASLLTGKYPLTNRVFQLYGHVARGQQDENIAEVLKQHGYATAAIVSNPMAHPMLLRIDKSFTILLRPPVPLVLFPGTFLLQLSHSLLFEALDSFMLNLVLKNFSWISPRLDHEVWVAPRTVFASAETFIRCAPSPYFLWIHLYPPHFPYLTEPPFGRRFLAGDNFSTLTECFWKAPPVTYPPTMQPVVNLLRLRYDERIAECDTALGEFLDWLTVGGRAANTVLVVTSDHGENFSGGWWTHESPELHYAETHIPLLISMPGESRGYSESVDADLADVAPTILSAVGIDKPAWMDGHSLMGPETAATSEPSFSMYLAESSAFGRPSIGTIAANSGPYRLVWRFNSGAGIMKLFDVATDPGESHFVSRADRTTALFADIQRRFGRALNGGPAGQR